MGASVHVVVMPYPSAGHSGPFVHFTKHLARSGVAVSFVAPDAELASLTQQLELQEGGAGSITLVPFAFPLHQDHMDAAFFFSIRDWMQRHSAMFLTLLAPLMRQEASPVCIISDMFLGFTQELADELRIPRFCLYSSPAHFLAFTLHMPELAAQGRLPAASWDDEPFRVPNFPPILPAHLPPFLLTASNAANSFFLEEARPLRRAAGVIVNTVLELEASVVHGLRESFPHQVMTIGPVLEGLWEGEEFRERVRASTRREACFDWLDQQRESSVLYVCFGSVATPADAQVRELAAGLERSGRPFLWVLRTRRALPEGFLERTRAKGFLCTDWAPQLHILAHPAVGGFLSHCGWNSSLEALALGVPLAAMPVMGDQMMNATLLVQVLGVGVRVNEIGAWFETIPSHAIEQAVRTLMAHPAGEAMRKKAATISATIQRSVRSGGSSYENLTLFVHHLHSLKPPTLQPKTSPPSTIA